MKMYMEQYKEAMVSDLSELIKIPSVYKESDNFLFGEEIDKCLDKALEIMKNLGFSTFKAEDGAYGYAEIGEGELIAVLGHLDVVNARKKDGWNTEPFEPKQIDGMLYGRGVQDDKGPIIATAYALKSILDEGYTLKKRIRIILGLDEENLWRSIAKYKEREEKPVMGFSPDASFPLTYAEKGVLQLYIKGTEKSVLSYEGGDSFNAVSPIASCMYDENIENAMKQLGYNYYIQDNRIVATGLTAHAMHPWEGENANLHLIEAIEKAGYKDNAISFINEVFQGKFRFEGFSEEDYSDFSGCITNCFSQMRANENGVRLSVDLRLPVSVTKEQVIELISKKAMEYHLTVEEYDWLAPIHIPKECELIQQLMKAYQEVTGDTKTEPGVCEGATYARAFENCVAFGACFPDTIMTEHEPNERISIKELVKASKVYKKAFLKLAVEC